MMHSSQLAQGAGSDQPLDTLRRRHQHLCEHLAAQGLLSHDSLQPPRFLERPGHRLVDVNMLARLGAADGDPALAMMLRADRDYVRVRPRKRRIKIADIWNIQL